MRMWVCSTRSPENQISRCLPRGVDALERAAAERMVVIDAGEAGKDGFEAGDRAARERSIERPGRTENTVAFWH